MIISILLIIIGLAVLIGGAELLVRGASSLARRLGIAPLVIGLTIVAFGTSAPEFVVSILSATQDSNSVGLGNIIGSNISNILLILGIGALINPLIINRGTVWKEIPFALLASIFLYLMANDIRFDGSPDNIISHIDGVVLMFLFVIFMYYVISIAKNGANHAEEVVTYSTAVSLGMLASGLAGLTFGGQLLVNSATELARLAGLSEEMIGLTIVAIGTSLPELATVIVASIKKQSDIAVGNVVGSNIFNIFWIVGSTATLHALPVSPLLQVDIIVAIGATMLLFVAMFVGRRHILGKIEGTFFISLYMLYMLFIIIRG